MSVPGCSIHLHGVKLAMRQEILQCPQPYSTTEFRILHPTQSRLCYLLTAW